MLQADHVHVRIHSKTLLGGVSLEVIPGEVLAIVGPNGAGKSTLLKVLSDEMPPSQGQVWLNKRKLDDCPAREQAQLRAILPQSSRLGFPFRVEEVVLMGRSPYRHSHTYRDNLEAAQQAIHMAQVDHLQGRLFTTLSGGEQQRVQLARVLAQLWNPQSSAARYLLLDEPTSALDLSHQHHVLGLAHHLAQTWNLGVLAVLHDLNLAALYADRVAILADGKLQTCGTPAEVLRPQHIQQAFAVHVDVIPHPVQDASPLVIARKPVFNLPSVAQE